MCRLDLICLLDYLMHYYKFVCGDVSDQAKLRCYHRVWNKDIKHALLA